MSADVTEELLTVPLDAVHDALGAKMVPFGGWRMPLQYSSILDEHHAVRKAAGLFDVSHMGEFQIWGPGAQAFVQTMVANDISKLGPRQALYTQLTRPDGTTVDDLLVYRWEDPNHRANVFYLVVNASNIAKDWEWLEAHRPSTASMEDRSSITAMLALQGPRAVDVMRAYGAGPDVIDLPFFHWTDATIGGLDMRIARTGYTGEDGYEIFCHRSAAADLWNGLLEAGKPLGLLPCGLGARDTLRLEAGLPLYGHELTDEIGPVMGGVGWSVRLDKGDFLGSEVFARQKAGELTRRVVGLKMQGRQIARQGYPVAVDGQTIGEVLSGTQSPTLQVPIATALVDKAAIANRSTLDVVIRGTPYPAEIVKLPFYRRQP